MNVFKIAWRSIQHRGLGSLLTILSMALGIMMVISVISIHGIVSRSFQSNSTFGYNVLVGARGGGTQLTMSSVFYLAPPVENIPYDYYLAFVPKEQRQREMRHSLVWVVHQQEQELLDLQSQLSGLAGGAPALGGQMAKAALDYQELEKMQINEDGLFAAGSTRSSPSGWVIFGSAKNRGFSFAASQPSHLFSMSWFWMLRPKRGSSLKKVARSKNTTTNMASTKSSSDRWSPAKVDLGSATLFSQRMVIPTVRVRTCTKRIFTSLGSLSPVGLPTIVLCF